MVVIESAGITDVGKKRKDNEDALFVDDDLKLYVVADGMGGHQAGEVASTLVVDTIRDYYKRFDEFHNPEELFDFDETLSKEANRLLSSIHVANRGVHRVAQTNMSYHGMGSTVSAVYFTDEQLIVANVGDSPIYLVHNGNIELLSVIHNVMAEHASIDPEGALKLNKMFKHMLTRAIGVEPTVEPDIFETPYFEGDRIIISSDGLSDKVSPEEILEIVRTQHPKKACKFLVDMANDRGGDDNITIIILNVKSTNTEKYHFFSILSRIFAKIFPKVCQ